MSARMVSLAIVIVALARTLGVDLTANARVIACTSRSKTHALVSTSTHLHLDYL